MAVEHRVRFTGTGRLDGEPGCVVTKSSMPDYYPRPDKADVRVL